MNSFEIIGLGLLGYGFYRIIKKHNDEARIQREHDIEEHYRKYYSDDNYREKHNKEYREWEEYHQSKIEEYKRCQKSCLNKRWYCMLKNNSLNRGQKPTKCRVDGCSVKTEMKELYEYEYFAAQSDK